MLRCVEIEYSRAMMSNTVDKATYIWTEINKSDDEVVTQQLTGDRHVPAASAAAQSHSVMTVSLCLSLSLSLSVSVSLSLSLSLSVLTAIFQVNLGHSFIHSFL